MKIKRNSFKITLASIFLMLGLLAGAETVTKDSFDAELAPMNLIGMSVNSAEGIMEFTIAGLIDREMLVITVDGLGEITQYCDPGRDAEKWDFSCTVYYSNQQEISLDEPREIAFDEEWVKSEISMAVLENVDEDRYRIKVKYPVLNTVDERLGLEKEQDLLNTAPNVMVQDGTILINSEISFTDPEPNNSTNDNLAAYPIPVVAIGVGVRVEMLNNKYPENPL